MAHYAKQEYWDDRYLKDFEYFDWYQRYSQFKELVAKYITPKSAILNIGCGNSRLAEELYDEGNQTITSIDFSSVLIKQLIEKYKTTRPLLKFIVMDARTLEFVDGSFDVIFDKGTLDSVLCGENSTNNALMVVKEIQRTLSPGGVYICLSFGIPEQRESLFKKLSMEIKTFTIQKGNVNPEQQEDDKKSQFFYLYFYQKPDDGTKKERKIEEAVPNNIPSAIEPPKQEAPTATVPNIEAKPATTESTSVKSDATATTDNANPQEEKKYHGHKHQGGRTLKMSNPMSLDLKNN